MMNLIFMNLKWWCEILVEKWKAQEIVQYLEEQLSNSLFHKNPEAMENGFNDIKEKYIDED